MKQTSFTLFLVAIALGLALQANAQDKAQMNQDKTKTELSSPANQDHVGQNYIDEDGDGVCDRQNERRRMHRRDYDRNDDRHMGRCGRGNRRGHDGQQGHDGAHHSRRQAGSIQK